MGQLTLPRSAIRSPGQLYRPSQACQVCPRRKAGFVGTLTGPIAGLSVPTSPRPRRGHTYRSSRAARRSVPPRYCPANAVGGAITMPASPLARSRHTCVPYRGHISAAFGGIAKPAHLWPLLWQPRGAPRLPVHPRYQPNRERPRPAAPARAERAQAYDRPRMSDAPQRAHDIVVFGATGFVGKLLAAYLAEHAP